MPTLAPTHTSSRSAEFSVAELRNATLALTLMSDGSYASRDRIGGQRVG
jgi:hypothetical protein